MAKILIAEDEEGVRSFLVDALELDGHTVVGVADGAAALAALEKSAFAVLLTDLKMPKVDGMALLAEARARYPTVEIIVLTAFGSVDTAVAALKQGAFDYLQKPVSGPAELRALVARAVERHEAKVQEAAQQAEGVPVLSWGAPAMAPVVAALQKVAPTEATVLLQGESGVGKEVAVRFLHMRSRRASGPLIAINCAALSEQLLESELFGHERGAFTGAVARQRGRIELAEGGTFFLDEVGELRPDLQARLLRVLQERRFTRVGGAQVLSADVRWIAATNRDLLARVREGHFREDLYYRLAVFPIRIPPLRQRPEDILPLARVLLARIGASYRRSGLMLDPAAEAALQAKDWSGNVRALANALERAVILSDGDRISAEALLDPAEVVEGDTSPLSMEEAERRAIAAALAHAGGNRRKAAEILGIGERTLYEKLKR